MRNNPFSRGLIAGVFLGVGLSLAVATVVVVLKGPSESDSHRTENKLLTKAQSKGPITLESTQDYDLGYQGPLRFKDPASKCEFLGELNKTMSENGWLVHVARVVCPSKNGDYVEDVAMAIPLEEDSFPILKDTKVEAYRLVSTPLGVMIDPTYFAGKLLESITLCKKSNGEPCFPDVAK